MTTTNASGSTRPSLRKIANEQERAFRDALEIGWQMISEHSRNVSEALALGVAASWPKLAPEELNWPWMEDAEDSDDTAPSAGRSASETNPVASSSPTLDSKDGLCDKLAERILHENYKSVRALAQEYRNELVRLGLMRKDSNSQLRRLQQLLATEVYGKRIPEADLPARIADGRRSGGQRQNDGNRAPNDLT